MTDAQALMIHSALNVVARQCRTLLKHGAPLSACEKRLETGIIRQYFEAAADKLIAETENFLREESS
jgi:hypothetical protein